LLLSGAARAADRFDESRLISSTQSKQSNRSTREAEKSSGAGKAGDKKSTGSWLTTLGSLTAVLALIFLSAKVFRAGMPAAQRSLPAEVLHVLGRKPLDFRNAIHLVRCGSRLIVVGSSQTGLSTLAEITDPGEIDQLTGLCQTNDNNTLGDAFQQLFRKFQTRGTTETVQPAHPSEMPPGVDPALLRLQARLQNAGGARDGDSRSHRFEELVG
jgi:flagellar biogenesis protein FliO